MIPSDAAHAAFEGGTHLFAVRVYYEDTDAGGIVYHTSYLRFAERARTEMLRALGLDHTRLMRGDGVALAVRHLSADFLRPAVLDDLLVVWTRLTWVRGASLGAEQIIKRGTVDLVRLHLRLGCLSLAGGAARMPAALRGALQSVVNKNG